MILEWSSGFVSLGKNGNFYRRIWLYHNCKWKQTGIQWPAFCINRCFLKLKKKIFKWFAFKVGFGACTELQVPFPIHLSLLCSVSSMSLSVGAAETSVYCVATLVSYHSSLRYGRVLVVFFLSLLDFVLELFYQHKIFLVISLLLTYIPPSLSPGPLLCSFYFL